MNAYGDLPPLVNAPDSPPALTQGSAHPSAGATPWRGPTASIAPPTPGPVLPGGFGAGIPQGHGGHHHHHHHPFEGQLRRTHSTPARTHISFPRSPSMGQGHNVINPLLAPQPHAPSGFDPFSVPAAVFDAGHGAGTGASAGFHQPWNMGFGGMGTPPPHVSMPSPYHMSTPRTHQQDPLDGEDDEGWNAFRVQSPASGGSSAGTGPSPSASVINGFATGPRSSYKRPEDWREGFSMSRPGPLTRVFSFGKGSKSRGMGLFGRPTLNKLLDAKSAMCSWDIRRPPEAFLVLPEQQPLKYLQLQEGAMLPEPVRMKIVHPMLPWTIHIDAGGPGCIITVGHLLASLYAELMRPVFQRDFWNETVKEEDRKRIYDAWVLRCNGDRDVASQGIKRVDFLLDRWVFEGLRRVGDCWEMKLKSGRKMM